MLNIFPEFPISKLQYVVFKSVINLYTGLATLLYLFYPLVWCVNIPKFNVREFPPCGVYLYHIFPIKGISLNGIDLNVAKWILPHLYSEILAVLNILYNYYGSFLNAIAIEA